MICEIVWSFNLPDLTLLRLNELNDYIDKWIIVEYPFGYDRKTRPLYFNENKERFKQFEDKIIHIIDDHGYGNASGLGLLWDRKKSPKIHNALSFLRPEDFLIVSDADAVLSKHVMKIIKQDISKIYSVCMKWYLWNLNRRTNDAVFNWTQTSSVKYYDKNLVVNAPGISVTYLGYNEVQHEVGWHFAKCGKTVDDIYNNIISHPHQDLATLPTIADKESIQRRIQEGFGWTDYTFGTGGKDWKWELVDYDPANYPDYINQHPEIYKSYFLFKDGVKNLGDENWQKNY